MACSIRRMAVVAVSMSFLGAANAPDYQSAARSLDNALRDQYAYMDKLPGTTLPESKALNAERSSASNHDSLLRYAEDRLASLADHHAITGSAFADSWAIIPTYADLWIVADGGVYTIDDVRTDSPAAAAGIQRGDKLVSIAGVSAAKAVADFWKTLGLEVTPRRAAYAARVLAAGRRDRDRVLGIQHQGAAARVLTLPSLYKDERKQALFTTSFAGKTVTIRVNNCLGDDAVIAEFDKILASIPAENRLVLDLRDTPSGGNATVARAIMGWFVDRARDYQVHNRPEEERATGIPHQWIEQVLPRAGKFRKMLPEILVGRWTGSMGEGIAIGFAAFGATVKGGPMAGLNGSVEDIALGNTGITVKIPTERLMTVTGLPREDFRPAPDR